MRKYYIFAKTERRLFLILTLVVVFILYDSLFRQDQSEETKNSKEPLQILTENYANCVARAVETVSDHAVSMNLQTFMTDCAKKQGIRSARRIFPVATFQNNDENKFAVEGLFRQYILCMHIILTKY